MNLLCRNLAKLLYVFVGNTSGLGVFAHKRLRSPKRILHQPWSRRRSILIHRFFNCSLARCGKKKHDRVPESTLTFHFKGQRSSGSSERNANAEAARRAAGICLGWRSGCSWWSHPWSWRTCCSVRICHISARKHDRLQFQRVENEQPQHLKWHLRMCTRFLESV